jgi:hypothetical protein
MIHEAGGDWILALKANEKEVHDIVSTHFRELCGQAAELPVGQLPKGVPISKTLHPPECDLP